MRTPRWLQRERMDAFEGHSNALEVSLVCKEAEEIMCPQLHRGDGQGQGEGRCHDEGDGDGDVDDGAQTQEQYLQVTHIYLPIHPPIYYFTKEDECPVLLGHNAKPIRFLPPSPDPPH